MEIWSQICLKPSKYSFEINFLLFFIVVAFSDKQVQQWQGAGWMNHNKHEYIKKLTSIFGRTCALFGMYFAIVIPAFYVWLIIANLWTKARVTSHCKYVSHPGGSKACHSLSDIKLYFSIFLEACCLIQPYSWINKTALSESFAVIPVSKVLVLTLSQVWN